MIVTYSAKRKISSGHVASTNYDLETIPQRLDLAMPAKKKDATALDGTTETLLHRLDEEYSIETGEFDLADRDLWQEFWASVIASEPFTIDLEGSLANPTVTKNAILSPGSKPKLKRVGQLQKFSFSFKIRIL